MAKYEDDRENSPEPEQRMKPHGNSKGEKHTNHREHDKMLHHMMPTHGEGGAAGDGDEGFGDGEC